ncbi:MAG TPA: hypothetical protein VGP68_06155 [Gemmataceae bacterium]|jgi:hypothetical protein|nr:hypothetical protein [Gemmataceae bacterium]
MAGRIESLWFRFKRAGKKPLIRARLSKWRRLFHVTMAAGLFVQASGCTRNYFRQDADKEVSEVLAEKDKYPDWPIDNWHIYPDPRARFADNTDPDHPPKPPDDPASYDMAPNPQRAGKPGIARIEGSGYLELMARWDKENRERRAKSEAEEKEKTGEPLPQEQLKSDSQLPFLADKPAAAAKPIDPAGMGGITPRDAILEAKERSHLDITDRPAYLLTLDQAAELAMFNSREYQDQRENLYLAALPVTFGRFSFVAQFFAAQEAARAYTGRGTPEGQTSNWSLNNGTGFSKVLPTGALLLLNFSNQTVFNFLSPKNPISVTTLNFNAIQPLLQGGGEAVALETLTQAERNLLYQIRTYARFRKELYVEIASQNGGSINGSAFQPSGVLAGGGVTGGGLSGGGQTPGVFVAPATTITSAIVPPNAPGTINLPAAITPAPSGYLNTMLNKIQVYIDQENIDVLSGILMRYRGLLDGDVVGPLQVQSVEQQLLAGRTTLLNDQQDYLQALDQFKIEVGVPMTLSIEMDDSVLQPLIKQFRRSRLIIENEQAAVADATNLMVPEKTPGMRAELLRLFEQSRLVRGTPFAGKIRARWNEWEKLSDQELKTRLDNQHKELDQLLDRQADLHRESKTLSDAELERIKVLYALTDLGNFERALRLYEATYLEGGKPKMPTAPAGQRRRLTDFQNVIYNWQKVLVEARDDQWAVVRETWPKLPRCCVDGVDLVYDNLDKAQAAGAQHALLNRLDLMNVRGQLVDSWRQLAIFANALLGTFTVQYELNANSPIGTAQPLNIGGSRTSNQLILNTELPITRIQQRNDYRAALIAYQRQRRTLQEAEDLAVQVVNSELYFLRQYADTYKLQQRQLELAYLTIDSSLESLQAPVAPTVAGQARSTQDGPAALTQQLLAAQRSLPTAQNGLLTVWTNYLDQRLQLYRDLELMPLDARGVWIDQINDCDCGIMAPTAAAPNGVKPVEGRIILPPRPQNLPASVQGAKGIEVK